MVVVFIFFIIFFIIGVFRSFNWRDEGCLDRFLRLICTEDGLVGSPFKKERIIDQWRVGLSVCEFMDAINDGLGDWFLGPAPAGDALPSLKRHKIVGPLKILGGAEGNGSGGAFGFSVGRIGFVVNLTVGTNGYTAVGVEICLDTGDDGPRGKNLRHTVGVWEDVQHHCCLLDNFAFEQTRVTGIRESRDRGAVTLFYGANATFGFWYVLSRGTCVEVDPRSKQGTQ